MLWNWYTVDACFISSTWQIKSSGMFAGSCIGVILLVMALEFMRRVTKEYDRYLIRKHSNSNPSNLTSINVTPNKTDDQGSPGSSTRTPVDRTLTPRSGGFRPSIFEQAARAVLHMVQFAVAYFIMLYELTRLDLMRIYIR